MKPVFISGSDDPKPFVSYAALGSNHFLSSTQSSSSPIDSLIKENKYNKYWKNSRSAITAVTKLFSFL